MQNWNRINAVICFNYLQQQFVLIQSTMQALAQGKKGAAIKVLACLFECTRGTQFDTIMDEDDSLKEIGKVLSCDAPYDQADANLDDI